jgi:hypothetical protein
VSEPPAHPDHEIPGPAGGPRTTGDDEPLNRLAAAVRRIMGVAVGHPVDDGILADAAEQLAQIADRLEDAAPPLKRPRLQPDPTGHPQDFFPTSPIIGFGNPIAPPVEVWMAEGEDGQPEIHGRVIFGYAYEGPPTCVHCGVIAELFDEMLGAANVVANKPAMTGTLTVRYRRPTPLLAPLDVVARFTRSEGRKVFTWGGLYHDGELTAEAEGIFIVVRSRHMLEIVTTNANATESQVIDPEFARIIAENAAG